jgi:hypothetical protein
VLVTTSHAESLTALHVHVVVGAVTAIVHLGCGMRSSIMSNRHA